MNSTAQEVRDVLVTTLGISDRTEQIVESTPLLNGIPELDSMALLDLVAALEQRFGVTIEDEDITGETFETLGSLTDTVQARITEPR